MPSTVTSGTLTPTTLGVEQNFAASDTTARTVVLCVDTVNLAMGETVELRIYTMAVGSGTERLAYRVAYTHTQAAPVKYSVPVPATHSYRCTITQTGGTLRAYAWEIIAL